MIPPQYMYTNAGMESQNLQDGEKLAIPSVVSSAFYDVQGDGSTLGSTLQHRHCFTMT